MAATLQKLIEIRSQRSEAALFYLRNTEEALAETPLLSRFGRSLDDVRIPLRVVPFEPVRHKEEATQTEHLRPPDARSDDDEPFKKRYAYPTISFDDEREKHHPPKPLSEVEPQLQHAVLLADPGGGKTEWLKYRARQSAHESRGALGNHTRLFSEITFPIFLRLNDVAKILGRNEKEENKQEHVLRRFLVQKGCVSFPPAALDDAQRVALAMLMELVQKRTLPEILVPFLLRKLLPTGTSRRTTQGQTDKDPPPLLCLDAWDEVRGGREFLARCLNAFAQASRCRISGSNQIDVIWHPKPVFRTYQNPIEQSQYSCSSTIWLCEPNVS